MSIQAFDRPLPQLFEWNRPFFEGGLHGRLVLQRCEPCRRLIYYPRIACPYCLSADLRWEQLSGTGTIYSYSVVWRPQHPAFEHEVPIILAVVDLTEGVQMVSTIVGSDPSVIGIGHEVRVVFDTVAEGIALPKFELTHVPRDGVT